MGERVLGTAMRVLLGLLGVIAVGAGVTVGLTELRVLSQGSPAVPTLIAAGVCALVVLGGVLLVRGALRGRIRVRRHGRRAPVR